MSRSSTEHIRDDGLKVFIDNDEELNKIKVSSVSKRKVIQAVAIRRAQQIALNYATRHAPELVDSFAIKPIPEYIKGEIICLEL